MLAMSIFVSHSYIYGLVQKRHNSSALAMELRLSCTEPSIYTWYSLYSNTVSLVYWSILIIHLLLNGFAVMRLLFCDADFVLGNNISSAYQNNRSITLYDVLCCAERLMHIPRTILHKTIKLCCNVIHSTRPPEVGEQQGLPEGGLVDHRVK